MLNIHALILHVPDMDHKSSGHILGALGDTLKSGVRNTPFDVRVPVNTASAVHNQHAEVGDDQVVTLLKEIEKLFLARHLIKNSLVICVETLFA